MGQARCVRLHHFFLLFANSQCRITAGPAHALPLTSPLFSAPHSTICLSAKRHLTSTIDHLPFEPGYHPLLLFDLCAVHPLVQYSSPQMPSVLTTPCDVTLAGFSFTIKAQRAQRQTGLCQFSNHMFSPTNAPHTASTSRVARPIMQRSHGSCSRSLAFPSKRHSRLVHPIPKLFCPAVPSFVTSCPSTSMPTTHT